MGTHPKILVVDDEPQIRRVLRVTLSSAGYSVDEASDGHTAMLALKERRPDLILLDCNLPGGNGLEVCRAIREISEVAIVMLTVKNLEVDKIAALDAGADDYVTKPFSAGELLARIRASLRRMPLSGDEISQVIEFDGIEIDFASRRVAVRGRNSRLTPKELDLLQYLVAHANIAIAHNKLLQAVWGSDYGSEVQYLHVFINQLRKKVEPEPAHPRYILTEPWVGYRFFLPELNVRDK